MSNIQIERSHNLSNDQLKSIVDDLGNQLTAKYGGSTQWQGDQLHYKINGSKACVEWDEQCVKINVKLDFMMSMLKSTISSEIERQLDKHL